MARLPCGGRRVVLFEIDSDPPQSVVTLIGPRTERDAMRRELAALACCGKRHHYLRGQALRADGSLPPGYGTTLPAGHDAYAIFETTEHSLKFRVYATVDVEVA